MIKIKELKQILEQFGDDEEVVLRIRPATSEDEVGTITTERISYVAIVYHGWMLGDRNRQKHGNQTNSSHPISKKS